MHNQHPDFGRRISVHRPSLGWLWWLVLCVAPLLLVTAVATVYAVMSLRPNSSTSVVGSFVFLGGSGLILLLVGAACFGEFRKWYATRTPKLVIYERGFTCESAGKKKGHHESCSWDDIKDITFSRLEVKTKNSPARRVSVIRAIVKQDGTVIGFAETLNLQKITNLIAEQRKRAA